jgi:integrase
MPKLKLTDIGIEKLKHSPKQITYWDMLLPAFGIRVGAISKTFIVIDSEGRRTKLGRYPYLSLADARAQARQLISQIHAGTSPNPTPSTTFKEAVESYLKTEGRKMGDSHLKEVTRIFDVNFLPKHGSTRLPAIQLNHITAVLDDLILRTPGQAIKVHARAKTFFRWAKRRNLISINPIEDLPPPAKEGRRDRVLTDGELKAVYNAAAELAYPFGYIALIAIHTGLRRANIAELQWSWISDDVIAITPSAVVSALDHAKRIASTMETRIAR